MIISNIPPKLTTRKENSITVIQYSILIRFPVLLRYNFLMNEKIKTALKIRRWLTVSHHIPGRIRLKYKMGIMVHLATIKMADVERAIASIPAFKNYKLNSDTGSILIEYDAHIINPEWIDMLFSESEADVQHACESIAQRLDMDGMNHE